jgi:hypothetical protein
VIWNVEQGRKLQRETVARAEALRAALFQRMRRFLEQLRASCCAR